MLTLNDIKGFDPKKCEDVTFPHDMIKLPHDDRVRELKFDHIGRIYEHVNTMERYYSVTTLLGNTKREADKAKLEAWKKAVGEEKATKVVEAACRRGNHVHDTAEWYLLNKPDYMSKVGRYKVQWKKFKPKLNKITLVNALEIPLYSNLMGVAGRVDCVGHYMGIPSIIDFKTSSKAKSLDMVHDYFLQCTMYSLMLQERFGIVYEHLVILMVVQKSQFCLVFEDDRKNWLKPLAERVKQFKRFIDPLQAN